MEFYFDDWSSELFPEESGNNFEELIHLQKVKAVSAGAAYAVKADPHGDCNRQPCFSNGENEAPNRAYSAQVWNISVSETRGTDVATCSDNATNTTGPG